MEVIYLGRQPIFDRKLEVYAYELLFRCGDPNSANGAVSGDVATGQVLLNALMDMGLDSIVGSRPAFVNLTAGFLDGRHSLPMAPKRIAIEVLEDVEPTPGILEHLRALAQAGYTIALDDYRHRPELEPLLDIAHLVKLDVLAMSEAALRDQVAFLRRRPHLKLVAEKVESYREFQACLDLGFDYFQGYFLAKPQVVQGTSSRANRMVVMQLLARLQDPESDLKELEKLIVQDLALSYRLLRHVNSACFALRREVESVRDALALIGTDTIRNWSSLILLTRIEDKPRELVNTALVRAKMCEHLATVQGISARHAYFTTGLLSVLDAIMDRPMEELLGALPLASPIKHALLRREGDLGDALQRTLFYEQAAWDKLNDGRLAPADYTQGYIAALRWANDSADLLQKSA